MGTLVIKFIPKYYPLEYDIMNLLQYIAGKGKKDTEKITYIGARGLSLKYKDAAEQIMTMQETLGKNKNRRIYHMIISFPENIQNDILITGFAKKVAAMIWEEHQVFYAIHNSTGNKHIHLAINAVSYKTCNKWHKSKIELKELKARIQNIWDCLNNGVIFPGTEL